MRASDSEFESSVWVDNWDIYVGVCVSSEWVDQSSFVSECERYLLADIKRFISYYGEYCMCELR